MTTIRRMALNGWVLSSMVLWAIDAVTTIWALNLGMAEGNPFPAWAQSHLGVAGYALVLLPVLFVRGLIAASTGTTVAWQIARAGCRALIVFHVVIVTHNACLIAAWYL